MKIRSGKEKLNTQVVRTIDLSSLIDRIPTMTVRDLSGVISFISAANQEER
jgi:hypothetical protein